MAEPERTNREGEAQPERLVSMAGQPLSAEAKDRVQARIEAQLETKGRTPVTATASATRTKTVTLAKSEGRGSPAIAAAVMLALMLGLFAMVSPWNRQQPIRETVSGDGDEKKDSPKPDESDKDKNPTTVELKAFESPEAAWKGFWDAIETADARSWESVLSGKDWDQLCSDRIKKIRDKDEATIRDVKDDAAKDRKLAFEVNYTNDAKTIASFACKVADKWPAETLKIRKNERGWTFFVDSAGIDREKEKRNRAACANNLAQLGKALMLYESVPASNCYPPALEILFRDYVADHRCFLCPSVKDGQHVPSPKWFTGSKPGEPNRLDFNDYLYIPGQDSGQGDNVIAFCSCKNHGGEACNVLLANGSVEWQPNDTRNKNVLATLEKLKISIDLPSAKTGHLTPEETVNVKQAIRDLGSDEYSVREKASQTLTATGPRASELLEQGAKSSDPEQASACKRILASFDIPKERRYWIESIRRELELDKAEKK